ncbi:MAG: SDR family NAD(P)-dependent oxidoreductase [Labrys sp. (in: a-proteobacteria)]
MNVRVALVTGAARGIGAAIAARLLYDGCTVVAADLGGSRRLPLQSHRHDRDIDITSAKARATLVTWIDEQFGRLDILVNNAGIFARTPLAIGTDQPQEAQILAVNADAPAALIAEMEPLMLRSDAPAIVNVASVRGLTASENAAAYSISKALVIDMTRHAAARFGGRIRVNAVAPGDIDTGMSPTEPEILRRLMARIPLGRLGRPEEVANVVAFLASQQSAAINGSLLPVDGGFIAT